VCERASVRLSVFVQMRNARKKSKNSQTLDLDISLMDSVIDAQPVKTKHVREQGGERIKQKKGMQTPKK